jgi:hypothetical protein
MAETSGVTVHKPDRCDSGPRLYSSRQTEAAHLIDIEGNELHQWSYEQGFTWHYAEMLTNGNLLAIIKEVEDEVPGMVIELNWESSLVWQADVPAHHDLQRLPNGNTLVVCREYVENEDIREGIIKSDYIVELSPEGDVEWEWHIDAHALEIADLIDVDFPREERDWAHTNTVESLCTNKAAQNDRVFRAGNILTSPRNLDAICVVQKSSGRVLWAWGPGELDKQHMPTMLRNGNILIFDNGTERSYSRIVEMDPIRNEVVWEYVAEPPESFFTGTRGASERLPNGNTFITDSNNGRLFEVEPGGEIVWEFLNPERTEDGARMALYRALRYDSELVRSLL